MLSIQQLCCHLIKLIHAPIRVYDRNGGREEIYVDYGEQQDPLSCDWQFEQKLLKLVDDKAVTLHVEMDSCIYGILVSKEGERYIMGPCSMVNDNHRLAERIQKVHNMDREQPYRISRCEFNTFVECLLMLFQHCADEVMDSSRLVLENMYSKELYVNAQKKVQQIHFEYREEGKIHNPYSQELREQGSIQRGDLEGLKKSFQETYVGEVGTLAKDSLRSIKNNAIIVIALACRSAIAGGIHPEIAFSVSDAYIQRIEELKNYSEVLTTGLQAEIYYTQLVREHLEQKKQSSLMIKCKAEISRRLHQRISVAELAEALRVNPNYLSQLFKKEEKISLVDYINREKISYAKQRLIYSEDSYGAIAFSFGFASQSYFGKVFKKWTGMTPRQYRKQYSEQS